jgi:signal transduction histidine kinase
VLAAVGLPAGRQLLIGLDDSSLCRWDLDRREMIGQPARVGRWAHIVATYVDAAGTATAFLYVPGDDDNPVTRVEQWRLDDGTRLEPVFPETLSAVFDDGGVTWGVLGERDGSLEVRPLDGAGPGLPAAVPGIAVMSHTGPVALAADSVGRQLQSPAGRHRQARRPRVAGPSDQALNRLAGLYAIALRLGGAVLFSAVALLAATRQVSGWWLGVALTVLCLWSACFTWRVRRSGLTAAVVLADAAVIAALELAQEHLVPAVLINDTTTWMLPLACTSVYILQLALRPRLGLSIAAIVVIAYGLGVYRPTDAWLLAVEAIVAAGLVAVIRGGARQADAVVAAGLETERQIRAEEARRADEREQHRQLHDTVLSTLTMVAAGAFAGPSPALTAQAVRDLRVLQGLEGSPAAANGRAPLTDLSPKLKRAAAGPGDLAVRLELAPVTLPSPVADQLAACVGEALRNVERHAGTGQAEVTVTGGEGWAVVTVTDRGRGFDPAATPPSRRGIRESITGRMQAAGGKAAVASRPGAGTIVTVSWPA